MIDSRKAAQAPRNRISGPFVVPFVVVEASRCAWALAGLGMFPAKVTGKFVIIVLKSTLWGVLSLN